MKITVLGATGGVGRHVVTTALDHGHTVTVLARTPGNVPSAGRVRVVQGDAVDLQAVATAVNDADVVISALGSTQGPDKDTSLRRMAAVLAQASHDASVPRIVWCASEGIDGEIPGLMGKGIMWLLRKPLADHRAAVETLVNDSGAAVTVARPRALNDKALDPAYTEVLDGPAEGAWAIPRASVADFLVKAAEDSSYAGASVALGTPK